MTVEERLKAEIKYLRDKNTELMSERSGIKQTRKYIEKKVVLGLCFAIPHLNCKVAQSVVAVMTLNELTAFIEALDELEVNNDRKNS